MKGRERLHEGEAYQEAFKKLEEWKKFADPSAIPQDKVPESFDLRNISGFDFTGKVRDQGGCASCYTMSFIQVVESRLR